jgi:hypothetical protein
VQKLDYVAARFTKDLEVQERFRREVDLILADLAQKMQGIFEGHLL